MRAAALIEIDGPGATTFTYDAFGRLTCVGTPSMHTTSLGLRAERNANGTVRRFVYDLSGARPRVVMETDGSNNPMAYDIWGLGLLWKVTPSGRFTSITSMATAMWWRYPARPRGVVNRYRYDPLGKLIASDESVENTFRARGRAAGWMTATACSMPTGTTTRRTCGATLPGTVDA